MALFFCYLDDQIDFFLSPVIRELVGEFVGFIFESFDILSPGLFFLVIRHSSIVFGKGIIEPAVDEVLEGVNGNTKLFGLVNKSLTPFGFF